MRFADIVGNEALKVSLSQIVDASRLPHAVLLCEDGPWGGVAFAVALSQYVNCSSRSGGDSCGECASCHKYGKLIHPDLHFVFPVSSSKKLSESEKKAPISDYFIQQWRDLLLSNPFFSEQDLYDAIGIEGKSGNISVHEARHIAETLSLRPFEAEYKTMIIYLPEKMNQEASNKLLKLLEEPPAGTLFILVSHSPEKIIPTVRSRCQMIRLVPLSAQEKLLSGIGSGFDAEYDSLVVRLLDVSLGKSLVDTFPVWEALADMGREKQREWCMYAEDYLRKVYMTSCHLDSLCGIDPSQEKDIARFALGLKPGFYERAFKALDSAISSVAGNVNAKLTFCNLCNIILLSA